MRAGAGGPVEALAPALTGAAAAAAEVLAGLLVVSGALWVLVSAVAVLRVRDALCRINALSPATGLGLTSIVLGAYTHSLTQGPFALVELAKVALTVLALLVVSSVASNTLARAAILSAAPLDPATTPNDLLDEPPGG